MLNCLFTCITSAVVAARIVGALLGARGVRLALVDVLAFLVSGGVARLVAARTEAHRARGRGVTHVRAAGVLCATVVAAAKGALVVAVRALGHVVAQLGAIDAHVKGRVGTLELIPRAAERQCRTVESLVRVVATIILAIYK